MYIFLVCISNFLIVDKKKTHGISRDKRKEEERQTPK